MSYSKDINCPYCDAELDIDHDDGAGYQENVVHQQECSECDKMFVFTTSISFSYEPEKADCLNDGEHIWRRRHTIPREFTKMVCSACDEERYLTPDEKEQLLNGTLD